MKINISKAGWHGLALAVLQALVHDGAESHEIASWSVSFFGSPTQRYFDRTKNTELAIGALIVTSLGLPPDAAFTLYVDGVAYRAFDAGDASVFDYTESPLIEKIDKNWFLSASRTISLTDIDTFYAEYEYQNLI